MKIARDSGDFTINRYDILVLDCALLAFNCDIDANDTDPGWRTLGWFTYDDIPGYNGKRLINSRLLEREYNENAGTYFYRITDDGRQIIELIKKRKGDRL